MDTFGKLLDSVLTYALLGPWYYTAGRAALLLALLLTAYLARRWPWLWIGLGINGLLLLGRVVGDAATGGADRPYNLYFLGTNLGTALVYIGLARMATLLTRLKAADVQCKVATMQRDEARAWVHATQRRLGEPLTLFPLDKEAS